MDQVLNLQSGVAVVGLGSVVDDDVHGCALAARRGLPVTARTASVILP
ncbi:hypothetical protein AB0I66_42720 [Streptomyces sp. NPDC050439]